MGLGAIVLLSANQALLEEWLNIHPQAPSAEVARLARATTMTRSAQRLFYRQHPRLESSQTFIRQCQVPEKAIMLGCYIHQGQTGKIVIQNVTDPRLKGTMEVTAAHEMLHAAYTKLRKSERRKLDDRLLRAAARVTDQRLLSLLQDYRRQDGTLYRNELHSHLGTELADLGDAKLEQHYQRYFHDRQHIVTLAQQSSRTLQTLDEIADRLKPEIEQLETTLKQLEATLQQSETSLQLSHQDLNALEAKLLSIKDMAEVAFRQSDPQAYQLAAEFDAQKTWFNQQVDQHNQQTKQHKSRVADFNAQVEVYKQKISEYNQAARESRNILDSLKHRASDDR